jgi:hypothetical protein
MLICVCANCGIGFKRYNMNATRAARPQFCCRKCQAEHMAKLADERRETRFWSKVDRTGECWVWTGYRTPQGYGKFQYANGQPMLAHRYAYYLGTGEWPKNFACHKCDNPWCVRPAHLFDGTHKENMEDCAKKGRTSRKPTVQGEKVNTAKLTRQDAVAIYNSEDSGPVLAARYGVTKEAINMIKSGRNWSWATGAKRESV